MSFTQLYLDKETFLNLMKEKNVDRILKMDSIIFLDKESKLYYDLLINGENEKLKTIVNK